MVCVAWCHGSSQDVGAARRTHDIVNPVKKPQIVLLNLAVAFVFELVSFWVGVQVWKPGRFHREARPLTFADGVKLAEMHLHISVVLVPAHPLD